MILVDNKIIIAIMDNFEKKENGNLINGCIYPMGKIIKIEVPENVIPQKYCYTIEKGFYINQVWEQSVKREIEKAIDEYTLEMIGGNL